MIARARSLLFLPALIASCAPEPAPVAIPAAPAPAPVAAMTGKFSHQGVVSQGGYLRGRAPRGAVGLTLDGNPVPLAADGGFFIAFDRDHKRAATLVATGPDGATIAETLRIAPRSWAIEHVDVAQRPSTATADYLRLRQGELARIAAARALTSGSEGWRQRFVWPARGRVSGRFGSQRVYRGAPGAFHSGTDVAAGAGAVVRAPADGIVVLAGPPAFSLEGNLVIIDHGMGLNSAFLHLARSSVAVGQTVRQSEPIGTVGATGRATGPHLHWSLKWNAARLDPELLAGPMPAA